LLNIFSPLQYIHFPPLSYSYKLVADATGDSVVAFDKADTSIDYVAQRYGL
jgi:hypothetical protein